MKKELMVDIGENVEYIKTIINNSIELKKLEGAEITSKILGIGILSLIIGVLSTLILVIILTVFTLLIIQAIGSTIYGMLIMAGIILLMIGLLYLMRNRIIYNPIAKIIMTSILK